MAQQDPDPDAQPEVPLALLPLGEEEARRAGEVDFAVDREAGLPVGTQLEWKIRAMLMRGVLCPGDRLPSVRELGSFARVNVNTARSVYDALEEAGLIRSAQGRGTFVADSVAHLREAGVIAAETLSAARSRGVDPREIGIALLTTTADPAHSPQGPFPEIARASDSRLTRKALREQIGYLERELAAYAWEGPATEQAGSERPPPGRLVDEYELQQIRASLIDRLREVRGRASERSTRQEAEASFRERASLDPTLRGWEVVPSEEEPPEDRRERPQRVIPDWDSAGSIRGWLRIRLTSRER